MIYCLVKWIGEKVLWKPILSCPPRIYKAIQYGSGQLALVIGAGCSLELPTSLRLFSEYARRAHENLERNGTLTHDCQKPEDLSEVADAVREATGFQRALVRLLPIEEFRNAPPNPGHLIAIALLAEELLGQLSQSTST